MPFHEIKDHDHSMTQTARETGEFGVTTVTECQHTECDYFHIAFTAETQTGLEHYQ